MQALDTYQGVASGSWDMLANIAKLRHLITSYIDAPAIRNPGKVFANLVSLKVWVDTPLDTFSVIGPYLTSLELLSFSPPEDSAEEIRVYHLTKISSQNLKYIEYFKQDFHPETEVAQLEPIFKHHLSLLAVHVDHRLDGHPLSVYQFRRDALSPVKVSIRAPCIFETWWEPVEDFLGNASVP
ncbi:hypothetical protein ONZ45_g16150 [Pleurotus djamor]|nr:hypothetical protein ONZ45_g16150 [Pleurotus djamor]